MSEWIIESKNLTKQYGSKKAVDSVSVHIPKGAIYGFIGRNGAGKTTFMKMVSGLSTQTAGDLNLFGKTGAESDAMRSRIGTLIEAPGLYPNMTGYDNLRMKMICVGIHKPNYIEDLLAMVGLANVGKKLKTKKYSLGMRQRLGIAMAMVGEPDLLVLDEPINGLDPQGIVEVRDTLVKLNRERHITILISSHILEELSKIATNYGIIYNAKLFPELSSEELMAKCQEKVIIQTDTPDAVCPILDRMQLTNYKIVDASTAELYEGTDRIADIAAALVKEGIRINGIYAQTENLEDFYLEMTKQG